MTQRVTLRRTLIACSLLALALLLAIVMMSLIRRLVTDESDRMYYGGVVIIAANSGGAWSPIGDVTTTMLWIGEQITAASVVKNVFVPIYFKGRRWGNFELAYRDE